MKFNFLAFKKNEKKTKQKKTLKIKITAIFFYQFVLNILYYKLYDLQTWKECSYAGDMYIKKTKKYVELLKYWNKVLMFLGNKTVKTFFFS